MSDSAKITEGVLKSRAQIVPKMRSFEKREIESRESLTGDSLNRLVPVRADRIHHSFPNTGLPHGLSFLSISGTSGTYPDTAESGEAYDIEFSLRIKTTRIVAPTGEYSE